MQKPWKNHFRENNSRVELIQNKNQLKRDSIISKIEDESDQNKEINIKQSVQQSINNTPRMK